MGAEKLKEIVLQEYPLATFVADEANGDKSIKFRRYGVSCEAWVALQCKESVEIYDEQGLLVMTLEAQ